MDQSIQKRVAPPLAELGLPAPTSFIHTILMKDGYFVGHKLGYDGGHAILGAGSSTIEFYDEQGKLLKTDALEAEKGAAA